MDLSRIDARLLSCPGATKAFHEKWGWMVYWVGGRQFACEFVASPDAKPPYAGRHLLSLKCDPDRILELRAEHPEAVLPGYYSDGRTWISIDVEADLPTGVVLDLCDMSYGLVFAKLPKRVQREIAGEHPHGSPLADGRIALRRAEPSDVGAIVSVVAETIRSVYPRYYPEPVVAKFLELHSEDAIAEDIRGGKVVVAVADGTIVGTGTVEGSHISRVFVLPGFQGRGVGSAILDELEERPAASRGAAIVESSLPACSLYERRGYRTVTHGSWDIPSADGLPAATLVWEVMEKDLRPAHGRGDGLDHRRDDLASRRGGATDVPMA